MSSYEFTTPKQQQQSLLSPRFTRHFVRNLDMKYNPRCFTKGTKSIWPNCVLDDGTICIGRNVPLLLTIELNNHKLNACIALCICVKRLLGDAVDKRLLNWICEKYVIDGLNKEKYWEHLIDIPYLTRLGQMEFKKIRKMRMKLDDDRREFELSKRMRRLDFNDDENCNETNKCIKR